jgi:hypothetical protein
MAGRQRLLTKKGFLLPDPLVITKCGSCHARDEQGNMQRISWGRATPEGWQDVLKEMILLHGVSVTPSEARSPAAMISYRFQLLVGLGAPRRQAPWRPMTA